MSMETLLVIVLGFTLVAVIRTWSYSRSWGYGPSGVAAAVVIIAILVLLGYI